MIIDLVVPYVNNADPTWQQAFDKAAKLSHRGENRYGTRYNDIGLFPYQLKLISKFMPFIRNIIILVSNISQLDNVINDLPPNVRIIVHKEFIPIRYLPTFNSTTIEMFLWNIPELAENFIYINDDMLPLKPLKESDFYSPSGKIKISWKIEDITRCTNEFRQVCYKEFQDIKQRTINDNHDHKYSREHYYRPLHSFTPMIKSHCHETYKALETSILKGISTFRTRNNHNQYIYPLYELLCLNNTLESKIPFIYTEIKLDTNETIDILKSNKYKIICINDNRMSMLRKIDTKSIFQELERRLK